LNPLRVVHLGKYYPPSPGGIEGHTRTLALAQAALGASVRVVVVNHADESGRDATFERFTRTPDLEEVDGTVRVVRVGRYGNLAKLDLAPGFLTAIRRAARPRPHVWHMHAPNITAMLAILACPYVRPLVITHHSDIIRQRVLKHAVRPLERAVYGRAARILPTSPAYIDGSELLQRYRDRVTPLPLGIDLAPYRSPSPIAQEYERHLKETYGTPVWLCVGRLIYYKGFGVALEALRELPGRLLVIGTGPMEAELKAKAVELGVADRAVFMGHASSDEVVGAYRAATAVLFPGTVRSEAFGLVQVEAMAAGCPVVNTAIAGSGVPWVCRNEVEGLTVPVDDPPALAAAARRLLQEPGLRDRLAAAARARAAEFDHRVMAERCLAIYREQQE
jgi:rhamnosyl/mannosyltransferase